MRKEESRQGIFDGISIFHITFSNVYFLSADFFNARIMSSSSMLRICSTS
jgi:hypothetical protein